MSCLSPISIINPSKYVSLKYRDPYLLRVPCGHCAGCQKELSNQWLFRTWQECCSLQDGYVYFDMLSYAVTPKMSDIIPDLRKVSCFSRDHIRHFLESLRIDVWRKYKAKFRFFIAGEYGHDNLYRSRSGHYRRGTNRPHYHVLFFVPNVVPVLEFSKLVSYHWPHGITDGIPFRSSGYVMNHDYISSGSLPLHYLRACNYVTKYVQKSCVYDKTIEKRLSGAMRSIAKKISPDDPDSWLSTVHASRVRSRLKRSLSQFHTQSKGFGASFLEEFDLNQYVDSGCVYMPSSKGLKIAVSLSTYYKRKLFYDLLVVDGSKVWKLNETGLKVRELRRRKLVDSFAKSFEANSLTYNLGFTSSYCRDLANYVFNDQGRINAPFESTDYVEKLKDVTLFNYSTLSDKEHLSKRGITFEFLGNNSIGYFVDSFPSNHITFNEFIGKYVLFDPEKEKNLNRMYFCLNNLNTGLQSAYEKKQDLENKFKLIRSLMMSNAPM